MEALHEGRPIVPQPLARPGWEKSIMIRRVPAPSDRPDFFKHPRLRRACAITEYTVASALEALGSHLEAVRSGALRTGVIVCTMSGSVQYSRRFYSELLQSPETASPLVFPETVFNAPASHLASLLGLTVVDYTLVGDTSSFFQGLAIAAHWLTCKKMDACLVVGAEEMDWPTADAFRLFSRRMTLGAGAGAMLLKIGSSDPSDLAILESVPTPRSYRNARGRGLAVAKVKAELDDRPSDESLLCDGLQGVGRFDNAEDHVWKNWTGDRLSPKRILGEGLTSATAWHCVAAVASLNEGRWTRAMVTNAGCNQQAGGASFAKKP
jgi:3-oxoacyl-(acyl-carrier-protein) synthase